MYLGTWLNVDYELNTSEQWDLSIAFSGYTHVTSALKHSEKVRPYMVGEKYIAFGGGDVHGNFNPCCVESITKALTQETYKDFLSGYEGIAYCLQEGVSDLAELFEQSFSTAQENGFKVLVSCVAPFNFGDEDKLLSRLLNNKNVDIFSPELPFSFTTPDVLYADLDLISQHFSCYASLVPSLIASEPMSDSIKESIYRAVENYSTENFKGRSKEPSKNKSHSIDGVLLSL